MKILLCYNCAKKGSIAPMFETVLLQEKYFRVFTGVYNDFRLKSHADYKFEIEPLDYNGFIEFFEKDLLKCVLLLEDDIPTGFLAYSTAQKNAIELFVVHCLGTENIQEKTNELLKKFLKETENARKTALVSYPMLGVQSNYKSQAQALGFQFVDLAVVNIDIFDKKLFKELSRLDYTQMPIGYKIAPYRDIYGDDLAQIILESFKNSSDLKFDPRFATIEGCQDIAYKITNSIYGRFLAQSSKILLHENHMVGFCLANITGDNIGNIPLVGILDEHRGMNLSEVLLKSTVLDVITLNQNEIVRLTELNASVNANNINAMKMYQNAGFVESYRYPQAYIQKTFV